MAVTVFFAQFRELPTLAWRQVGDWVSTLEAAQENLAQLAPKGREYRILSADAAVVFEAGGPPTLASLTPNTAVVGGPDVTMTVAGTGFTAATQVVWNGTPETTVYVSATEITTVVKPSTASGPGVIPVGVTGAPDTLDFTFTAA
jgi:hypothetical protein